MNTLDPCIITERTALNNNYFALTIALHICCRPLSYHHAFRYCIVHARDFPTLLSPYVALRCFNSLRINPLGKPKLTSMQYFKMCVLFFA
jgi:hypothetical protein